MGYQGAGAHTCRTWNCRAVWQDSGGEDPDADVQRSIKLGLTRQALSTFVGTFLFSIVGIIALMTGLYGAEGRAVLFFATIVIVAVIAITLLRWI